MQWALFGSEKARCYHQPSRQDPGLGTQGLEKGTDSGPFPIHLLVSNCRGSPTHTMPGFQSSLKGAKLSVSSVSKVWAPGSGFHVGSPDWLLQPHSPVTHSGVESQSCGQSMTDHGSPCSSSASQAATLTAFAQHPPRREAPALSRAPWSYPLSLLGDNRRAFKRK